MGQRRIAESSSTEPALIILLKQSCARIERKRGSKGSVFLEQASSQTEVICGKYCGRQTPQSAFSIYGVPSYFEQVSGANITL